ncbi:unnamed protein product [Prorocentrum cordatum]|uniref:Uncharacterized protein n=1 Tax=Prorocentrum cordatum TaxID=2364126 RepID=A0ABN9PNU1_9DINO|nr:unnamed protein product [Polarella glacialis]
MAESCLLVSVQQGRGGVRWSLFEWLPQGKRLSSWADQARLTNDLKRVSCLSEVVTKLWAAQHVDGVDLNIAHMSAAWVSMARQKAQLTEEDQNSEDFDSLVEMTQSALTNPDSSWKHSVKRHHPRKIGQPVALVLWSVATLHGVWPKTRDMMPCLAYHMQSGAQSAHAQNVANALWAFGIMHTVDDGYGSVVTDLMRRALSLSAEMNSQQVSNMCWGLARRKRESHKFCSAMAGRLLSLSAVLSKKAIGFDLTQAACAFAVLNFRSDTFMEMVAGKLPELLDSRHVLPDWDLCAVHWAFDQLYPAQCHVSTFDGVWKGQGTIEGRRLIGDGGQVHLLQGNTDGTISWTLSTGESFTGKLVDNGTKIEWSDGDVWVRGDRPFAVFQEKLHQHVSQRSLAHRLTTVPVGPECWYFGR